MNETVPDKSRNNTRHTELSMGSENDKLKKPIHTDLSEKRWLRQKPKPKS
jgi:hypothetical protein